MFLLLFLFCVGFGHNQTGRTVNQQWSAYLLRPAPTAEVTVLVALLLCKAVAACLPVVLDVLPRSHGSDLQDSFSGIGCYKADIQV